MDDRQLDTLLLRARPEVATSAEQAARHLAESLTALAAVQKGPHPRRRWPRGMRFPVGAAAAVLLAGGATVTAYQLGIPPFQTLDSEFVRSEAVPVEFRTDAGMLVHCKAFLEYREGDMVMGEAVNAVVTEGDWADYGQRMYDALAPADKLVQIGPGPTGQAALADLQRRAIDIALGSPLPSDGAHITGTAISCTYPEGAPE